MRRPPYHGREVKEDSTDTPTALLEASPDITNLTIEGQLAHRYSQYHDLDSPHYSARGQILKVSDSRSPIEARP